MLLITQNSSPKEISEYIKSLREQKGREKEVLAEIQKAVGFGHDFVVNMLWEEALTYQHMIMNNPRDKRAVKKMAETVLTAKFYVQKYGLTKWRSRLFRFMGRVSDYKREFGSSVGYYRKAILYADQDPEPYREMELEAFLSYGLIMAGKTKLGYKLAKDLFNGFESTPKGKALKKSDYNTWAVWRSGIVVRTVEAFIVKRLNFGKTEFEGWIKTAQKDLQNGDFGYRRTELAQAKKRLLGE